MVSTLRIEYRNLFAAKVRAVLLNGFMSDIPLSVCLFSRERSIRFRILRDNIAAKIPLKQVDTKGRRTAVRFGVGIQVHQS